MAERGRRLSVGLRRFARRPTLWTPSAWLLLSLVCATPAWSGAQREEALSDAVRHALHAAIAEQAPPQPVHADAAGAQEFEAWLGQTQNRLQAFLAGRSRHRSATPSTTAGLTHELDAPALQREWLQTVWYESRRAGLDPALVLGLIEVESGFRKFAVSPAGARGYMQVMPFWSRLLVGGDASELFHGQANLRYGCVILRHYLDLEQGDLVLALGRYNGSRGQMAYPRAVLAAQKQWARSAGPSASGSGL